MRKFTLLALSFVSLFFVLPQVNAEIAVSPLKYEIEVEQGNTVTKKIKVTNEGEEAITLYTSTEDFIAGDSTGKPKFLKPEEQENPEVSLSNWVQVKEKNLTLTPGETREIDFEINVPEAGEPGGHYGAVFFSPGIQSDGKVAFTHRLGVLLLIEVPGELLIDGNLESFEIGEEKEAQFTTKTNFDTLPVSFQMKFKNNGNIHLKPQGRIELVDENGEILKNIGKETIVSPTGTYVGEKMVDYIPVNDAQGVTLPRSERNFTATWEGFGYNVLNEDGTNDVKFKGIKEYYEDKAAEKQAYLKFWEEIRTKTVTKTITANYNIFYEAKDKEKKEFVDKKTFEIEYEQKYIGLNQVVIWSMGGVFVLLLVFLIIYIPRRKKKGEELKKKHEEELRKKIMEEMKNKEK